MVSKARTIQSTIRNLLTFPASGLVRIPETENRSVEDAIRVLQVQIFELSDALAEFVEEYDKGRRR